jgi:SlyX protein
MTEAAESTEATYQRLMALEIKASFAEDLLEQLNDVIVRQQRQIDALIAEVSDLRERPPDASQSMGHGVRDDLPPHY